MDVPRIAPTHSRLIRPLSAHFHNLAETVTVNIDSMPGRGTFAQSSIRVDPVGH